MKRKSPVSVRQGSLAFTLVELLVVIAIIVILMSLLLTAVPAVKKAAGKAEARNTANMVVTALNAYYTEYAKFPPTELAAAADPNATVIDVVVGSTSGLPNNTVFYTLRNIPKGPNAEYAANPRKITFYEGKTAKPGAGGSARNGFYDKDKSGGPPGGLLESCLFDPWGQQYGVIMDVTGDDRIDLTGYYTDYSGVEDDGKAPRRKAGAFSSGEDEVLGSKDKMGYYRSANETSDDVVSWDQ